MTLTIEVALSIPISRLPDAGMIAGMACGSTTRRKIRPGRMPSAAAASACPGSTERMPPRMISAENAATSSVRPTNAASRPVNRWAVRTVTNSGPNGIPSPGNLYRNPMNVQKTICTSTGVPRKNQA